MTFTYLRHDPTSNCSLTGLCLGPWSGVPALGERFSNHPDTLLVAYDGRIGEKVGVLGSLGAVRRSFFSGDSATDVIGGAGVRLYPTPDLTYGFEAGREAVLDTAPLVENEIDFNNVGGNVVWGFAPEWWLRANAVASWISHGNQRLSAYGSVGWRIPVARPRAEAPRRTGASEPLATVSSASIFEVISAKIMAGLWIEGNLITVLADAGAETAELEIERTLAENDFKIQDQERSANPDKEGTPEQGRLCNIKIETEEGDGNRGFHEPEDNHPDNIGSSPHAGQVKVDGNFPSPYVLRLQVLGIRDRNRCFRNHRSPPSVRSPP